MTLRAAATLLIVLAAMPAGAQEGFPLFTSDFPPEEFAARREKVCDEIGEGAVALIQGAPTPEGFVRFRQSNQFYYLCGVETPHAYLLVDGSRRTSNLYLPHRDESHERSEGKQMSPEIADEVRRLTGIDAVFGLESLSAHLARFAQRESIKVIYTPFRPAEGLAVSRDMALRAVAEAAADPWDGSPAREGHFAGLLQTRFPAFEVRDLTPILDRMRLIKSPRELEMIRKATRLSGLAIMEAIRSCEPGIFEYELDAALQYICRRHGAQGDAYYSLIASGPNIVFPHYHANTRRMQDGDLVLLDYAPDYGYYMSDLTRTWPVDGRFSPEQRELYLFYIGCYKAVLHRIKVGKTARQVAAEALVEMDKLLTETTFSKDIYARAAKRFVDGYRRTAGSDYAGLGHWVGMSTHDVGSWTGPYEPGMVFTIEPPLVVPEEGIYIRAEDLIIITEDGAEIPSGFLPLEIDDIEALSREQGILQRDARDPLFNEER